MSTSSTKTAHKKTLMQTETKIIIFLLLLPPVLGELLSGSTPPLAFFNPFSLIILTFLYGCGTLLIREVRTRWNLQWSVLFLVIAYGILEEGIMMQSFFNHNHPDLGVLSHYGMYFGIQWPWTIMLLVYHATISTLIPIAIVDLVWPEYRNTSLLRKRGIILASLAVLGVTFPMMVLIWVQQKDEAIPYHPDPFLLIGSFLVVVLLIVLAYRYRNRAKTTRRFRLFSPWIFAVLAFLLQGFNVIAPNAMAKNNVSEVIILAMQFVEVTLVLLFILFQLCHQNLTKRHIIALVTGSVLFFILLTPIAEFANTRNPDPTQGMSIVGIIGLILLLIWRRRILKKDPPVRD